MRDPTIRRGFSLIAVKHSAHTMAPEDVA